MIAGRSRCIWRSISAVSGRGWHWRHACTTDRAGGLPASVRISQGWRRTPCSALWTGHEVRALVGSAELTW